MTHPHEETLHLHIDGELPGAERGEVEAHLRSCAECVRRADEVRGLLMRVAMLDREIQPPVDLWQGIVKRIAVENPAPEHDLERLRSRRRVYQALGWIGAIAATLVLGIGLGRMTPGPTAGTVATLPTELSSDVAAHIPAPDTQASVAMLAAAHEEPAYDSAISELETVLYESSQQLRPETIAAIQENLAIIDQAIAEAQGALLADPANEHLRQHIATNKQTKLRLLRTLTTTVTADL